MYSRNYLARSSQVRLLASTKYRVTRVLSGTKNVIWKLFPENSFVLRHPRRLASPLLLLFFSLKFHLFRSRRLSLYHRLRFGLVFHRFTRNERNKTFCSFHCSNCWLKFSVGLLVISIRDLHIHLQTFIYICFFHGSSGRCWLAEIYRKAAQQLLHSIWNVIPTEWKISFMSVCARTRSSALCNCAL